MLHMISGLKVMYRVITIAKYFQRDKSYSIEVGFKSAFKKKK